MVTVFRDIPISNNPVDYISVIKMLIYSSTKMKRFFFLGGGGGVALKHCFVNTQ